MVFFMEGSSSQILVSLLVALATLVVLQHSRPYRSEDDDTLASLAQPVSSYTQKQMKS